MTPETATYLARARETLADARCIAVLPMPHIAAREAYLAAFHAAEAYIFERTGKVAKTHRGVRVEFGRLAREEPRIGHDVVGFLADGYDYKEQADYAVGPSRRPVTPENAATALGEAARFIETVAHLLSTGENARDETP